ncbi:hypothetical protein PV325_012549 [Microctonus aethiopoides]|nr:hypothetical protein PV325_012549 [Microctonus aethiopoides]
MRKKLYEEQEGNHKETTKKIFQLCTLRESSGNAKKEEEEEEEGDGGGKDDNDDGDDGTAWGLGFTHGYEYNKRHIDTTRSVQQRIILRLAH